MKCLKCLKLYAGKQSVKLNEHLAHLSKWGVCADCDDTGKYASDYYHKNKERYKKLHKGYKANLTNSYVANIIVNGTSLKAKEIPEQLIVGKRQQMQIKRIMKEQNDGNE